MQQRGCKHAKLTYIGQMLRQLHLFYFNRLYVVQRFVLWKFDIFYLSFTIDSCGVQDYIFHFFVKERACFVVGLVEEDTKQELMK